MITRKGRYNKTFINAIVVEVLQNKTDPNGNTSGNTDLDDVSGSQIANDGMDLVLLSVVSCYD